MNSDVRLHPEKAKRRLPTATVIGAARETEKGHAQGTTLRILRRLRTARFAEDTHPFSVIQHGQRRFAQIGERSVGQPFIPRPGMRGPEYRLAPGLSAIIAANVKQRVLLARSVKGSLHGKNQAAVSSFDNSVRLMYRRQSRDASHGTNRLPGFSFVVGVGQDDVLTILGAERQEEPPRRVLDHRAGDARTRSGIKQPADFRRHRDVGNLLPRAGHLRRPEGAHTSRREAVSRVRFS